MSIGSEKDKRDFWIGMMERLNASTELYEPVPVLLRELCRLFSFGCGFIYQADYTRRFYLKESYVGYENSHLRDIINLWDEIDPAFEQELSKRAAIVVSGEAPEGGLERALANVFNAKSMILIPVTDYSDRVMGLVGVVDRRGERTIFQEDMDFAQAILSTLANHVKLEWYQVRVQETQKALENMLDNSGVDIYVCDYNSKEILYANRSMAQPYGGQQNMVGNICWQFLYDDKDNVCAFCPQNKVVDEQGRPTEVYSWDYQRPYDGRWFRVLSAAFPWMDGRLALVNSSVDITENMNNQATIRRMAEYDTLTGLPNRRKLLNDCEADIPELLERGEKAHLLFFDLDGFKKINDTMGHRAGDDMLVQVRVFLEEHPLTRGHAYRYGGDEFVVWHAATGQGSLAEVLEALETRFTRPWVLADGEVLCNCSIGVAVLPDDDADINELLYKADMALYEAKNRGKGRTCFYNGGEIVSALKYLQEISI